MALYGSFQNLGSPFPGARKCSCIVFGGIRGVPFLRQPLYDVRGVGFRVVAYSLEKINAKYLCCVKPAEVGLSGCRLHVNLFLDKEGKDKT